MSSAPVPTDFVAPADTLFSPRAHVGGAQLYKIPIKDGYKACDLEFVPGDRFISHPDHGRTLLKYYWLVTNGVKQILYSQASGANDYIRRNAAAEKRQVQYIEAVEALVREFCRNNHPACVTANDARLANGDNNGDPPPPKRARIDNAAGSHRAGKTLQWREFQPAPTQCALSLGAGPSRVGNASHGRRSEPARTQRGSSRRGRSALLTHSSEEGTVRVLMPGSSSRSMSGDKLCAYYAPQLEVDGPMIWVSDHGMISTHGEVADRLLDEDKHIVFCALTMEDAEHYLLTTLTFLGRSHQVYYLNLAGRVTRNKDTALEDFLSLDAIVEADSGQPTGASFYACPDLATVGRLWRLLRASGMAWVLLFSESEDEEDAEDAS
ncbi:hypothetical protein B0H11DRAFT_2254460 [Mycena galericulata]|nr:hypothetical protein B0H11DRAFT_2254460 [Mycena galericulata]